MKKMFQEFTYNIVRKGKLISVYTVAFPIDEKDVTSDFKMGFLVAIRNIEEYRCRIDLGERGRWENPWKYPFTLRGGWIIGPMEERQVFTKTVEHL